MFKRESVNYKELRKKVSKLFFAVLTHKIPVRDALAKFPKDCEDPTLIAAWHALCHLESDEEMRLKDKMYAEEQDNYIEYIAFTLEKGEALVILGINIIVKSKSSHVFFILSHSF